MVNRVAAIKQFFELTDSDLCNIIGVSNGTLTKMENAGLIASSEQRDKVAEILHIRRDWLDKLDDEELPSPFDHDGLTKAERITNIMAETGMTQREFSETIGIAHTVISKIQRGKVKLVPDTAQRIADKLNVGVEWLLYGLTDYKDHPVNRKMIDYLWRNPEARIMIEDMMKREK